MDDADKAAPVVVVVGAGPAGLRAVETLVECGVRPILIDEAAKPGGQIYRQPPTGAERAAQDLYGLEAPKAVALHGLIARLGDRVEYWPETLVWGIDEGVLDLLVDGRYQRLAFDRLILATGAMDRVLPFPGWTLPGVFTLGAAQIALKAQGMAIGRRVVLVGAGPLLPLVGYQYMRAGADIAAILDVTPFAPKIVHSPGLLRQPKTFLKGLWYTARLLLGRHPIRSGVRAIRVEGQARVEALTWTDANGHQHSVACDGVGASFGLRSEAQLADLAGCRFFFDPTTRQWQPERSPEGRSSVACVYLAGDGASIGGADVAELQGRRTALSVITDLGLPIDHAKSTNLDRRLKAQGRFRQALEAAYPFPDHLIDNLADDETVCRCEGVTVGTLRAAALTRGTDEINRLKALTRIGMGRCQGRVCGQAAAEILARTLGVEPAAVGRLRGNPPVKPIPVRESF
jgi:NADPH-dependent 2,4-dienoyl-CoA reductase/sulfur reductase-like enzyme